MSEPRVLLVGETWIERVTEIKGVGELTRSRYVDASGPLREAFARAGTPLTHVPCHDLTPTLPMTARELSDSCDVLVLSDVPYESLLDAGAAAGRDIDAEVAHWVREGGSMLMIGGWASFSGYRGMGGYHGSSIEGILPVLCTAADDRAERPGGAIPVMCTTTHPLAASLPTEWPAFYGWNRVKPRGGSDVLVRVEDDALLVVGGVDAGRSAAFLSDCTPHWCDRAWPRSDSFRELWPVLAGWLARCDEPARASAHGSRSTAPTRSADSAGVNPSA